ncbi:hypothetical protein GW915_07845 [bacterium]|nr:hypothetical protein [bacterium]
MSGKKIAIFGTKEALGQTHAKELRESLDALKHEVILLPIPKVLMSFTRWKELVFDWVIFVGDKSKAPSDFKPWSEVFSQLKHQPLFASWTFEKLAQPFRLELKPDFEFIGPSARGEILESLGLKGATEIKSEHFLSDVDLNLVELSQKVSEEGSTGLHTAAFLDEPSSLSGMPVDSNGGFEVEQAGEEPQLNNGEDSKSLDLSGDFANEPSLGGFSEVSQKTDEVSKYSSLDDLFDDDEAVQGDLSLAGVEDSEESQSLGSASLGDEEPGGLFAGLNDSEKEEDQESGSLFESPDAANVDLHSTQDESSSKSPNNDLAGLFDPDEKEEALDAEDQADSFYNEEASFMDAINEEVEKEAGESFMAREPKKNSPAKSESAGSANSGVASLDVSAFEVSMEEEQKESVTQDPSIHSSQTVVDAIGANSTQKSSALSSSQTIQKSKFKEPVPKESLFAHDDMDLSQISSNDSDDMKTIKRYALLKEREAREKASALTALKNEFSKCQQKLENSEIERRKMTLKVEELDLQLRTSLDKSEEHRHQFGKMEQGFQEQLKDLKVRLESAQFQTSKSERRLDEFRERVRNDIQRIRVRERELANRLELQKRDAEALLAVKDERLLQQKREIDRLQFEVDSLRERLEEEVERSEERSKKLGRAMQSLKLAQGMLSGLEDVDYNDVSSNDNSSSGEGEAA